MKNTNRKIGLYPLVGDLLHTGHILALEEASENCNYLIVALNCTPEGKNPVQSIYERFMQLRAIRFINEIIPYQGRADMESLVQSLNYDIRFIGEDYLNKTWDGKDYEIALGKEFYYLKRRHDFSSTSLKERVLNK